MKKYTLLFLFFLPLLRLSAQQRIYVNHTATGSATGQNWANAYTDLQLALQSAAYGDTMWVAAGTYKPTSDNNRDSSFGVPNGLRLYGGFSGTETELAQRDWAAHPVVLSGDIGVADDTLDNSYNIMYMAYPDSFTVVDGFTFRFGYAQPPQLVFEDGTEPFICGGALYIMGFEGSAYPDIRHCTFEYNYAWAGGGAVFVNGDGEDASVAPRFLDCTFRYNNTCRLWRRDRSPGRQLGGAVPGFWGLHIRAQFCLAGGRRFVLLRHGADGYPARQRLPVYGKQRGGRCRRHGLVDRQDCRCVNDY